MHRDCQHAHIFVKLAVKLSGMRRGLSGCARGVNHEQGELSMQ